jgi:hypothetical protein
LLKDSKGLIDWEGVSARAKERLEEAMCALATNNFIPSKDFEQRTLRAWATEYMMGQLIAEGWEAHVGTLNQGEYLHRYNLSYSDGKAVLDEIPLRLKVIGDMTHLLRNGIKPTEVFELSGNQAFIQLPFFINLNGDQAVCLKAKHLPIVVEDDIEEKKLADGNRVWVHKDILSDLCAKGKSNVLDLRKLGKDVER